MATLYENYISGWDEAGAVYGSEWIAQTFTPATAHKITSVKLELFRAGSPGEVTVSIRATDGGHPSDGDLCSGTTDGDTLPTSAASAEWREITLGAGFDLDASTKYAIVVRAIDGGASDRCYWLCDKSSPTYAGGCREDSSNSGVDWSTDTSMDFMFEDWGEAIVSAGRSFGFIFG